MENNYNSIVSLSSIDSCNLSYSNRLKESLYTQEREGNIEQVSLKSLMNVQNCIYPLCPLDFIPSSNLWNQNESVICYTTTQVYKEKIEGLTATEIPFPQILRTGNIHSSNEALTHVILPTLFAKNILIRPPLPSESDDIMYEFRPYELAFLEQLKLFSAIQNEGLSIDLDRKRIFRVVVASSSDVHKKIQGAIFYYISQKNNSSCKIEALDIKDKHKSKGLGTLLMGHAILEAKQFGCRKIKLIPSYEGSFLYASLGFYPNSPWVMPHWKNMDLTQKAKILYLTVSSNKMDLNLINIQNLYQKIVKILNNPPKEIDKDTQLPKGYVDFDDITLPDEIQEVLDNAEDMSGNEYPGAVDMSDIEYPRAMFSPVNLY